MEFAHVLHHIGAVLTLGVGAVGLLRPDDVARMTGLEARDRLGGSALRATYGGLFTALGLFTLATQDEVAFALVGAAWLGAAAARLGDAFLRGGDRRIWRAASFEAGMALLLLAPV